MNTEAYPLQWPEGRPRTPKHSRIDSKMSDKFTQTRDQLINEIKLLKGKLPVISSCLMLRKDGLPLSHQRAPEDTGVAVYFTYNDKQMCFACDKYKKIAHNLRAITLTIEALRGIARWGTGDMMEQAFSGFAALPDHSGESWRDILGAHDVNSISAIEHKYKLLRSKYHPDKGGDAVMFHKINKAWEQAKAECED